MKKWVAIKRYEKGTYALRSKNGEVCIAPLKDLPSVCNISREELQELIKEAIRKGEIGLNAWMLDEYLDN